VVSFYVGASDDRAAVRYAHDSLGVTTNFEGCIPGCSGSKCATEGARRASFSAAFERLLGLAKALPAAVGTSAEQEIATELGEVERVLCALAAVPLPELAPPPTSTFIDNEEHDDHGNGGACPSLLGCNFWPTFCSHAPSCALLGVVLDARRALGLNYDGSYEGDVDGTSSPTDVTRDKSSDGGGSLSAGEAEFSLAALAFQWTALSAELGDGGAMANLATLVEAGRGPDRHVRSLV
jgi:hypothetical protein